MGTFLKEEESCLFQFIRVERRRIKYSKAVPGIRGRTSLLRGRLLVFLFPGGEPMRSGLGKVWMRRGFISDSQETQNIQFYLYCLFTANLLENIALVRLKMPRNCSEPPFFSNNKVFTILNQQEKLENKQENKCLQSR